MKLRFEKNSIRYRIRKTELDRLTHEGFVQETIQFPHAIFTYELRIEDVNEVTATLYDNLVAISIPRNSANIFINTDQVGIYSTSAIGDKQSLQIIIEKDFPCKDGPEDNRSDKFTELAKKEGRDEAC